VVRGVERKEATMQEGGTFRDTWTVNLERHAAVTKAKSANDNNLSCGIGGASQRFMIVVPLFFPGYEPANDIAASPTAC
jgi:hypothetical protein